MNMICVEHLTRDYGGGKGVFDLSFEVREGEVFGFLGPNGAGKTTTIRHLMGFLRARQGRCTIGGLDCLKSRAEIQKKLGYIPGEIAFFEDMTGTAFLDFCARYRGLRGEGRRQELLERFELRPDLKIRRMSKGMKQKVGIVAAFAHNPEVLILDEPTGGLDPLMQKRFIELLAEEKQKGRTILLSSHMFEEVERTCDRIAMIRAGKLAAIDSVENLRRRHVRVYRVALADEKTAEAFAQDFGGEREGTWVTVSTSESLEDIFLRCYGGDKHD